MQPFVADGDFHLYVGDALETLRTLPAESVHCCVTSPPYWGLRDYGTGTWEGGDADCDHKQGRDGAGRADGIVDERAQRNRDGAAALTRQTCRCGASRVDQQLGLEATPDEYVTNMVNVFREVRRVLRADGTLWLNIGDSYAGSNASQGGDGSAATYADGRAHVMGAIARQAQRTAQATPTKTGAGLKPKDLVGIPWRLAFALQQPYYTGTIKDERDRIWLAAMVEAEGCLFIHKRGEGQYASSYTKKDGTESRYHRKNATYGAGLEVASTDRVIAERCMAIAGIGSISEQSPEQNERRKQTIYRWSVRSNECRGIIRELYPHFVAKQHEARLLLGCPSSGPDAEKAHASLKAIHQGEMPGIDFAAPESMFEAGWYLRSDCIWSKKPNPMPESVTDRPTKAHEYLFLLTKSPRYFYDADAIREPPVYPGYQLGVVRGTKRRASANGRGSEASGNESPSRAYAVDAVVPEAGRNKRSVWEIATEAYPDAHFATFPQALVEPCVKAGTSAHGCCGVCGAPWVREVKPGSSIISGKGWHDHSDDERQGMAQVKKGQKAWDTYVPPETIGWSPGCECVETGVQGRMGVPARPFDGDDLDGDAGAEQHLRPGSELRAAPPAPVPCVVLDPFLGSGTTALVARRLGRRCIGIELNSEYARLAAKRLAQLSLFACVVDESAGQAEEAADRG